MKKNKKKGFTLIELIVVIAIIGILSAILIPSYISYIDNSKIVADRNEAKNMNTALQSYFASGNDTEVDALEIRSIVSSVAGVNYKFKPASSYLGYSFWYNKLTKEIILEKRDEILIELSDYSSIITNLSFDNPRYLEEVVPNYMLLDKSGNPISESIMVIRDLGNYDVDSAEQIYNQIIDDNNNKLSEKLKDHFKQFNLANTLFIGTSAGISKTTSHSVERVIFSESVTKITEKHVPKFIESINQSVHIPMNVSEIYTNTFTHIANLNVSIISDTIVENNAFNLSTNLITNSKIDYSNSKISINTTYEGVCSDDKYVLAEYSDNFDSFACSSRPIFEYSYNISGNVYASGWDFDYEDYLNGARAITAKAYYNFGSGNRLIGASRFTYVENANINVGLSPTENAEHFYIEDFTNGLRNYYTTLTYYLKVSFDDKDVNEILIDKEDFVNGYYNVDLDFTNLVEYNHTIKYKLLVKDEKGNVVSYQQDTLPVIMDLEDIVVEVNNNTITWNNIFNEEAYKIYVYNTKEIGEGIFVRNGNAIKVIDLAKDINSYTFTPDDSLSSGKYFVYVEAIGDFIYYLNSASLDVMLDLDYNGA